MAKITRLEAEIVDTNQIGQYISLQYSMNFLASKYVKDFSYLIDQCYTDPSKRPTANELSDNFGNWYSDIYVKDTEF